MGGYLDEQINLRVMENIDNNLLTTTAVSQSCPSVDDIGPEKTISLGKSTPDQHIMMNPSMNKDNDQDITSQIGHGNFESTIKTFKPYERNNKQRRTKYSLNPTLVHFDSLFGGDNWARFLIIKAESKITYQRLENYLLTKYPSEDMSVRQIKPCEWMIGTTTKNQSEEYRKITKIDNINVNVTRHDTMNSVQGTLILPEDEEPINKTIILDSLQKRYKNVENIEIYEIPSKRDKNSSLKIAKVKFSGQNLPQKIKILGQNREIRPYVPKPLQCRNCSKFGHTTKKCRSKPVCAFCASIDHETVWKHGTPKCVNCGQKHHARAKECSFYIYNTELKILQERTGMTIREAKLELKVRGFNDPSKKLSYGSIAKQNIENQTLQKSNRNTLAINIAKGNRKERSLEDITTVVETGNEEKALLKQRSYEEIIIKNKYSTNIEDYNPYNILTDMNEEVITNQSDILEFQDQKKRPLERTPPKNKRQNINNSENGPSVKPKINMNNKNYKETQTSKQNQITTVRDTTKSKHQETNISDIESTPTVTENVSCKKDQEIVVEVHKSQDNTNPETLKQNSYKMEDIITPSPVITTKINIPNDQHEITHDGNCGCNMCFIRSCKENDKITKDILINTVRNFMKFRRREITNLQSHEDGCMCVNHLIYYKERHIQILDKFLERIQTNNSEKENIKKNEKSKSSTSNVTNKISDIQQKNISNNSNKVNSKTTLINRKNLNTSI